MSAVIKPSDEPTGQLLTAEEFMARYENARPELVDGVVRWGPTVGKPSDPSAVPLLTAEEFMERYENAHAELVDGVVRFGRLPPPPVTRGFVVLAHPASGGGHGMLSKVVEHLRAGAAAVILLNPLTRSAMVYRPDAPPTTHRVGDTLAVPDVLPGFAVPVAVLFE
jgi:hypothetical protein